MDYTQLDLDHKQELLCNARQLYLAYDLLKKICADSPDELINEIWKAAHQQVDSLSETQINQMIVQLEQSRSSWKEGGLVIIVEPEN